MKIKRILVSQPEPATGKSPYLDLADKFKVKVDFRPFIKVEGLDSLEYRKQHVSIPGHTAVVFTSRLGIDNFFRLAKELRIPIREDLKYFCTSEAIAVYLQKYIQYRKRKVFFGNNTIDDLVNVAAKHTKEKYLLILADANNSKTTKLFDDKKINYTVAKMYRTVSNPYKNPEDFDYDMVLFFSPSGIKAFKESFPDFKQEDMIIGCLGSQTAKTAKRNGMRLEIEVPSPKYSSLSVAVEDYIKQNHKRR